MHRLVFVVVLFTGGSAVAAPPIVVDLWPGKTPGDLGIKGQETSRIHQSPLVGPTKLITNVTKPTITVYSPPPEKNNGTAMVICPGGGYWDLYWELEGEEVAAWLNSVGMTGIILKYRCPRRPGEDKSEPPLGPQLDAQRAIRLVRSRAAEWGINPKRIGIVGFSAGGHLALATSTNFSKRLYEPIDAIDAISSRPDFAVMCYSGLSEGEGKGRSPSRHRHSVGYAAHFCGACVRRQGKLRRLRFREQRRDLPRAEARGCSQRAAHLRHGRS